MARIFLGASAKREWLMTKRNGPWKGERRQAKRRIARILFPAFLSAQIFIERETFDTFGCEADKIQLVIRGTQENLFCYNNGTLLRVPVMCALQGTIMQASRVNDFFKITKNHYGSWYNPLHFFFSIFFFSSSIIRGDLEQRISQHWFHLFRYQST